MNASLANFARNRFVYELASHRIRVETASDAREIEEDPRWMRAICA